jgi:hypothetical protein
VVDNLSFLEDDDSATGTGDGLRFDGSASGSAVLLFLSLSLSVMEYSSVVCRLGFLTSPAGLETREGNITERLADEDSSGATGKEVDGLDDEMVLGF